MNAINIDIAEHYKWGNGSDGWHLLKSDSLSIIQERVTSGECEQRHYHNNSQQFFYILSGVAHIEISGKVHEVTKSSGLHVAAKEPHQLMNKGKADLIFLLVSEPMSHDDRVKA